MDLETMTSSACLVTCCDCGCVCSSMNRSYSGTWLRTVKRKLDEVEECNRFVIPGLNLPQVARVEAENERDALREMREKAEIQMEARQFKRFAEEKMAHDQRELLAMEDLLYKREEAIQSLYCEVQAYKHRMLCYGITESEVDGDRGTMTRNNSAIRNLDAQCELTTYDYPPLKCNMNETPVYSEFDNDVVDVEKYAFGETPRSWDHLKDLERLSTDSSNSFFAMGKEIATDLATESPRFGSLKKREYSQPEDYSNLRKVDNTSEGGDDMSDRVYTIDSIHQGMPDNGLSEKPSIGVCEDYLTTPRESLNLADLGDPEIKKLYTRLQALEADRESMRQAIISMRTDKAQLVLLKEIAQHLCKDMSPARKMPVKKPSIIGTFSFMSVFKVLVWDVSKQCGLANAFRQGPSRGAMEMSFEYTTLITVLDLPQLGGLVVSCIVASNSFSPE
ncbi:myosin-binding protein [Actinidia rufa]|uniref:Myosin-binding protein n=1 Tax=Actinidia rufa TaxID=165716 RepID=A0A7J0GEP0_9ERIC|nr:myosin-binding protein [Actinidia rufa]